MATAYTKFYTMIKNMPIWVKQILYYSLQKDIEENIQQNIQLINKEDLLQFYIPERTFRGDKELKDQYYKLQENQYIFLECCDGETDMATIAMNNNWSLTDVAKFLVELINIEFLERPGSDLMYNLASFLCGNLRLGEYCKRIDKIGIDAIAEALNHQNKLKKMGQEKGIADILVDMNFLSAKERDEILMVKEDSARVFRVAGEADAKMLAALKAQNAALKEQLKKYKR